MAGTSTAAGGLHEDPLVFPGETTHLIKDKIMGHQSFSFGSSVSTEQKMLCFGGAADATNSGQEPASICMDYTSLSSTPSPKSNKKRKGSGDEPGSNPDRPSGAPAGSKRRSKTTKSSANPSCFIAGQHAKIAKKEKLGERITALQQLVSPFGKTDTASVLHEALGYIRFLQDQVQVLCSPYLYTRPAGNDQETMNSQEKNMDLRSKGLCLVPIELTSHICDEPNGADLWSSAAIVDNVSIFRL